MFPNGEIVSSYGPVKSTYAFIPSFHYNFFFKYLLKLFQGKIYSVNYAYFWDNHKILIGDSQGSFYIYDMELQTLNYENKVIFKFNKNN